MSQSRRGCIERTPCTGFIDMKGTFKVVSHLARTTGPDGFFLSLKRIFGAKNGLKESLGAPISGISLDPLVLQHLVHGIDGTHKFLQNGSLLLVRDFDMFVQCSTVLGHRGDEVARFFDRCFEKNSFGAQPERYGACPTGRWEDFKDMTPQPRMFDAFERQVSELEGIIDEYMGEYVGTTLEVGTLLRKLAWDLLTYAMYGVRPCGETRRMWEEFEFILPEFDYAVRMAGLGIAYKWSERMTAQLRAFVAWSKKTGKERMANLHQYENQNDVLSTGLRCAPDKLDEIEMQLRGTYSGGFINFHCALCGTCIHNSTSDDAVYEYFMREEKKNLDNVLRETLHLYSAIPITRRVREQDNLMVNNTRLATDAVVMLSTYALGTDERTWENASVFDASRFEGTKKDELGFMTQKGFAPLGVDAPDMAFCGRPCYGRYGAVHVLRIALAKILRNYRLVASRGGYFDFKQSCGAALYMGHCKVRVHRR